MARLITYVVIAVAILNLPRIVQWVCGVGYVDWGLLAIYVILVVAYEKGLFDNKKGKTLLPIEDNEPLKPLIDDKPTTNDELDRQQYVSMLGRKIVSTYIYNTARQDKANPTDEDLGTAFAINIEEDYGYGKTSFLLMLREWFNKQHKDQAIWIDFRPWLCDNASSLISEFFHQLAEEISIDIDLRDDIIRYGNELASQAMKYAVGVQTPLLFKAHGSSLKHQHDRIREQLNRKAQLIIVTIDDLDRLDKEEVMAVLKLIRDTADFPNIFYITATEHTYLYNVLKASNIDDPDRFIEKFFNLHFYLPAHEVDYKNTFISLLGDYIRTIIKDKEKENEFDALRAESILKTCFSDIRDVKRFVNQLIIYLESLDKEDYNLYDATLLALLQYKCSELYKILRDRDDILLYTKYKGTDCILELKEDPVAEVEQQDFLKMMDKDKSQSDQENKAPVPGLAKRHGKEGPYRNEKLGERILHVLFGTNTSNDEFAIKRTNNFFLYFSGREHSKSITKAETAAILNLELEAYKTAIDELFKQDRADAFLHEIEYVIRNAKETDILDIIRKVFYFQYCQYDHTPKERRRERSWYAISIQNQDLYSILYDMIGDSTPSQYRRHNKPCPVLTSIIREEPLIYVVELVSVLDRDIGVFEYKREVIDRWVEKVYDRLFAENLDQNYIFTEDNLYLMEYFRGELYYYRNKWDKRFTDYLCSDKNIISLWLSHLIKDYGGRYEWNFSVKRVMFGSPIDYQGDTLMSKLKARYIDLKPELDDLEQLLKLDHLEETSEKLKDDLFVKEFAVRRKKYY